MSPCHAPPLPPLPSAPHVDGFHGVPFATCTHLCALSLATFALSQGSDFCLFYSVRDRCPHVADTGNYTERCSAALKTWVLSDQIFLQCYQYLSFAFLYWVAQNSTTDPSIFVMILISGCHAVTRWKRADVKSRHAQRRLCVVRRQRAAFASRSSSRASRPPCAAGCSGARTRASRPPPS